MGRLDDLERDRQIADIQAIFASSAEHRRSSADGAAGADQQDGDDVPRGAGRGGGAEAARADRRDGEVDCIELDGFGDGYEPPRGALAARVRAQRRPAAVFVLVAVIAAAATAMVTWFLRPVESPVRSERAVVAAGDERSDETAAVTTTPPSPPASASEAAAPATVVVAVVGQVATPGLVTLPEGARVSDAIAAAGGALPDADLTTINIARRVTDGEQIAVGVPGAADQGTAATGETGPGGSAAGSASGAGDDPAGGSAGGAAGGPAGTVNINTAGVSELDTLPGIGPVIAQRIVDFRTDNGPFTSVDELLNVSGVGPAVLAKVKEMVSV